MNSRERVQAVIHGQIPDRIPIDIGGSTLTGISVDEYIEVADYLGIDCEMPKVVDQYQMLARVEGPIRDWFHSDVICLENPTVSWGYKNRNWKPWRTETGNNVLVPGEFNVKRLENGSLELKDCDGKTAGRMPKGGLYFDRIFPNIKINLMDEIEFMDPDEFKKTIPLYTDEELKIIEKRGDFFAKNTELSVLGEFLKGNLGTSGVFAGHPFTQWMCVVMLEPDYAVSLVEAYAERTIENFKLYRQAVGNNIDTIFVSSTDFGTQNAEFYRPDVFKEIYFPSYKKINDYIHGNSEYKIIFHSCGSIRNILPYFVEAGVDILNPVQISAAGMDAGELKKEFGDKIIFWGGGIDTQHIYPDGTAEEVRAHVKERIEILGKDGGFVFTPIHNTQYGVPPENIEAMIETVLKYGRYDSGRGEK